MGTEDIILISVLYPALAALLFIGARKADDKSGFMDRAFTKAVCGFFSICIIMHHISQELSDYRIFKNTDTHGLGAFFYSGYLFVGWFLFCSGFGLTKSFKHKENYLEDFGKRRAMPIIVTFVVTGFIYLLYRSRTTGAELPANPYSWYVYTLIILYGFFYFSFKKLKKRRTVCVAVLVLLYCVFCRLFAFGEWWFNSAPVFVLGMLAAIYEDRLCAKLGAKPLRYAASFALLFALFFAASRNTDALYRFSGRFIPYAVLRESRPVLQAAAASFFCLAIAAAGMKIHFGGRQLAFLGGLTLEAYLIQGIFIRIFGKYLFDGNTLSSLYIRNKLLYTAAVIAAAVLSAFALNKLCSLIANFIAKAEFSKVLWKDAKKAALAAGIIAAVITLFYGAQNISASAGAAEKIDKYRDENIRIVKADDTEIAAYISGSGNKTVVLLRSEFDACPTMTLRPLADALAENGKYRAVVLDFPGQGFSGEAKTERTAANIADEIHSALSGLGVGEPVILAACDISGLYALSYTEKYPDSVSAFIGIDPYVPELTDYMAGDPFSSDEEYTWALRRYAEGMALKTRLLNITGYSRIEMNLLGTLFETGTMSRYNDELTEMYMRGNYNEAFVREQSLRHQNCLSLSGAAIPEDMPALFMIDNYYYDTPIGKEGNFEVTLRGLYEDVMTNKDIQEIIVIDNYYIKYYNPRAVSGVIDKFLDKYSEREE